jgi:beta-mannosidase
MADMLGILIIQSFMFNSNFYPANIEFVNNIMVEVEHQVNRLKHHPSVIAWEGNSKIELSLFNANSSFDAELFKNDYMSLFVDRIPKLVKELDSRPYLRSSPSNGAASSLADPNSLISGDIHFFENERNLWDYEQFKVGRFMSEFGVQSVRNLCFFF